MSEMGLTTRTSITFMVAARNAPAKPRVRNSAVMACLEGRVGSRTSPVAMGAPASASVKAKRSRPSWRSKV